MKYIAIVADANNNPVAVLNTQNKIKVFYSKEEARVAIDLNQATETFPQNVSYVGGEIYEWPWD
jgi:hypothetical protein